MSYTNDPVNSATDRIRLNVGDTDNNELGLSDEVYLYLLDTHNQNENITSLEALKLLVFHYAKYADEKAGELEEKGHQKYNQYKELYESASKDPNFSFYSVGEPFVGGITIEDRIKNPSSNPFKLSNPLDCSGRW